MPRAKRPGPIRAALSARAINLGLLLFGLLNPVVESMRGLCAATELRRVQREVSTS